MNLQSQLHTYKESFLHSAARTGRLSECASLLSMDPNLDWCPSTAGSTPSSSGVLRTESNDTALLAAARGGHKDVVALLLAHGASVNRRTAAGETILHLAVNSGAVELVSLVVEAMEGKEDVLKCKDKEGKTALALATEKQNGGIMVSKLKKALGLPSSAADEILNNSISRTRRTVEESRRAQHEVEGDGNSSPVDGNSDGVGDDDSGEWETDTDTDTIPEPEDGTPDAKIPHAMSASAWHRLHSGGGNSGITERPKTTGGSGSGTSVKVKIPMLDVEHSNDTNENSALEDKFKPSLLHLQPTLHSGASEIEELKQSLLHSRSENTKIQNKLNALRKQTSKIDSDLIVSESTTLRLRNERDILRTKIANLSGKDLKNKSLEELEGIETLLREGLKLVGLEKERKVKEMLTTESDKRMCVICQESPKCVLLMPCRHLCCCKDCSRRNELTKCPLCRQIVTQKIDVFA